jgi:hypothetical protein
MTSPTELQASLPKTYPNSPRLAVRLAGAASALLAAVTALAGVDALALNIVQRHHAPSVHALEAPRCGPAHPDA